MLPLPARDRSSNDRNDKHNKKGVHKRAHKSKEIKSAVLFGKSSDSRLRPASFQEKAAESHDDKLAQSNDKATVGHVPNVKSPDTFSKPRGHFRPSKAALVKQFINTSDDNQYYCELCFRHYEPGEFHHKFSMHEDRRDFLFNYVGLQCLDEWSNDRIYVTISLQLESTLKEICPNRKYINMSDQQLGIYLLSFALSAK